MIYKKELTPTLLVVIVSPQRPEYESLYSYEWNFTGRYRYRRGELEIEISYMGWGRIERETTGFFDKWWNGTHTSVEVEKKIWVDSMDFKFQEAKPIYTYDCHCSDREPEVTYG